MNAQLRDSIMQIVRTQKAIQKTAAVGATAKTSTVGVQTGKDAKTANMARHTGELAAKDEAAQQPRTAPVTGEQIEQGLRYGNPADEPKDRGNQDKGSPDNDQDIPENPSINTASAALGAAGLGAAGYGIASHFGGSESTKVLSTLAGMFGGGVLGHAMARYIVQHPDLVGGKDRKIQGGAALNKSNTVTTPAEIKHHEPAANQ